MLNLFWSLECKARGGGGGYTDGVNHGNKQYAELSPQHMVCHSSTSGCFHPWVKVSVRAQTPAGCCLCATFIFRTTWPFGVIYILYIFSEKEKRVRESRWEGNRGLHWFRFLCAHPLCLYLPALEKQSPDTFICTFSKFALFPRIPPPTHPHLPRPLRPCLSFPTPPHPFFYFYFVLSQPPVFFP